MLHLDTGQSQNSLQRLQCMFVRKIQHAAGKCEICLHHHGRTDKKSAFAKQFSGCLKVSFWLTRQESQNDIGVDSYQRIRPQASPALRATSLQRMLLPFKCGASMPATSSTLLATFLAAFAAFNTASPSRSSQLTWSLGEICKAASIDGGTDKPRCDAVWRIFLTPKIEFSHCKSSPHYSKPQQTLKKVLIPP
jgi:hypothetical protein